MNRKIINWLLLAFCLTMVSLAQAQQAGKISRVGYVSTVGSPDANFEELRQGLRDLGYVEGKDILVEYRYAEGESDRYPGLVNELVQLKVDVIVIGNLPATRAAKQATTTIPIVMVLSADPVATGIVDSLARPGGNITGLTRLTRDLSGKRLELLKEVLPGKLRGVGLLGDVARFTEPAIAFKEYEAAASALKVQLQVLGVRGPNPDLEGAFQAADKGRVSALITIRSGLLNRYAKRIADLAIKHRLPSMHEGSEYVEAGGLVSYAVSDADQFRRAATYVDISKYVGRVNSSRVLVG